LQILVVVNNGTLRIGLAEVLELVFSQPGTDDD